MPELTSRLESYGKSSNTDTSAHGAAFDDLGIEIARIESSDTDQNNLTLPARQILDKFSGAESRFFYGLRDQPPSIELNKVLFAMLSHAQDCGGQEGLLQRLWRVMSAASAMEVLLNPTCWKVWL